MLNLPPELEPYREVLEGSVRQMVVLQPQIKPEGADAELTRSKLGGTIFWPEALPYPTIAGGRLFPLAQLNLAELPALAWLPESGLLQVFIDDDYGVEVIYHGPEALGQPTLQGAGAAMSDFEFFDHEVLVSGAAHKTAVLPDSYDWQLLFGASGKDWFRRFDADGGRIWSDYERECTVYAAHHIGGYNAIERVDHECRYGVADATHIPLLLAINGDDDQTFGCMFGNYALYIEANKLALHDFGDIWLTFESRH